MTVRPSPDSNGAFASGRVRRTGDQVARFLAVAALILHAAAQAQAPAGNSEYCTAQAGYRFEFPRDHFSHDCFRTEWWYFTGNLTSDGRQFGYQLTFFRDAVDNPFPNPSRWRLDNLYLAHFAITDIADGELIYAQRISRGAVNLAAVDAATGRIWNGRWSARVVGNTWTLRAADGEIAIHLELVSRKPAVIQGRNGISQKGPAEGNASHYYSLTRLETSGTIQTRDGSYEVAGWSWMDHEFSTSQLEPGQTGWDWISLHMNDGSELMLFQLKRTDATRDPFSAGSFADASGRVTQLTAEDFAMMPLETWTSPRSGAQYPIRWRVRVPRLALEVETSAAVRDQELDTRQTTQIIYWEGSIAARGTRDGAPVEGRGYLEMTGYAGPLPSGLYSTRETDK
jgi:predicted secreted hydrolase